MKERDVMLKDFDSKISFNQEILYQLFGYERKIFSRYKII